MRFVTTVSLLLSCLYAAEIKVDADAITKAHNDLRAEYGSPALVYSKNLENQAQKWATTLQKNGCTMVHSQGGTGENLFWASAYKSADSKDEKGNLVWHRFLQKVNEKEVVQAWYDEEKWYDYKNNSCQQKRACGHYTQVIWETTTELGCAAAACSDGSQVWVCEYAPPGNIVGERPY
ncbi:MAG: CAP domain-containing protein [Thiovulaceae bacterium]|nr:CAP domain-containing protein [Sulfurimonadaceae bacterium]